VPSEQRIRAVLFYLSLSIFLIGLPFILSFALGYKFNPRNFHFTKAGLIALKTQPEGASVYFNGKLLNEKTPTTINELLPGQYNIGLELERHYPWFSEVEVEAGKVTRLEKIILFPLRSNIKQLNKDKISSFWVDKEKDTIYYLNQEDKLIYKSDLKGESFEEIASLPEIISMPRQWKISADREKLLLFNQHQIVIVYLETQNANSYMESPIILNYSKRRIIDIFWYSDSYHLVLVSDRNIEVLEARPRAMPINLVNLNRKNISAFYDDTKDTLYFIDSQKAEDGKFYDNVYKLELGTKISQLRDLIKLKSNE